MFETLPQNVADMLDWRWEQFAPYAESLTARRVNADTVEGWLKDWSKLGSTVYEMYARLSVATTVDTTDERADAQYKAFLENVYPQYLVMQNSLNMKLLESGLEPDGFAVPLRNIRGEVELFREKNLPLLTEESKLSTEYDKILGAQTVEWDGEERTLAQLAPVFQETDRDRREKAWRLSAERQAEDTETLNDLWIQFMDLRKQIAANADSVDYREYRWKSMNRFDYTPDDAQAFFEAIEQVVVPAAERMAEKRRQHLGLDTLRPWDLQVDPLGREPLRPFNSVKELESKSENIFQQVDSELGAQIQIMREEQLFDLENRKGKAPGGYCIGFAVIKRPFIFMNAVGIHDDVQTMLHESGHAFHAFAAADLPYMQQFESPMEFAEVASMAMELLAAPYLIESKGGFYTEAEAARARIEHLEGIVGFWPYMAVVASFQHWVYTNHEVATDPTACNQKWSELWGRFMKGMDVTGLDDWVATGWQRKLHIYQIPFYYIEYGLAQLGAVQVWANSLKDRAAALNDYRQALALGGTASLPELFQAAGAKLAFDAGTLGVAVDLIENTVAELEAS